MEDSQKLKSFSNELYDRYGLKNYKPKLSEYEQHEIEMIKKRNANESYKLVSNKPNINIPSVNPVDKTLLGKKHKKSISEKDDKTTDKNTDIEDNITNLKNEEIDYDNIFNINSIEDKDLKNLMKEKDRLERDLLDKKLKEKDSDKNKRGKTLENPLLAKINLSQDEKMVIANELRKMSRYSYLKMRSAQQLDLWKRRLEDEKKLFNGVELTEEERRLNEINQQIYELASKKLEENPDENMQYKMPDGYEDDKGKIDFDKKYKVLYERYKEHKKEEKEDEVWEKQQKVRSLPKYGAMNVPKPSDKYSFVLENSIDFVQKDVLEGFIMNKMNENNVDAAQKGISKVLKKIKKGKGDERCNLYFKKIFFNFIQKILIFNFII